MISVKQRHVDGYSQTQEQSFQMATKRSSLSTKQQRIDRVMALMAIRGKSGEEQSVADFIKKQII